MQRHQLSRAMGIRSSGRIIKKNNAAHLLRLHLIFSRDEHARSCEVPKWWQQYLERDEVPSLAPPKKRGAFTVMEVASAKTAVEHTELMRRWALSVYGAWDVHHDWAEQELARILK